MDADTANSQKDRWIIFFDDADRRPMHFSGEGAEQAAHRTFATMLTSWSCRLFKTIELDSTLAGCVPTRSDMLAQFGLKAPSVTAKPK